MNEAEARNLGRRYEEHKRTAMVNSIKERIEDEKKTVATVLGFYRNSRTGRLTQEGMKVASHRNYAVSKMEDILKIVEKR